MSETDVLKALVDGTLAMCAAPGCSHTFKPVTGRRFCGEPTCARHTRECSAPWCTNRVPRHIGDGGTKGMTVFCSVECEDAISAARRSISVRTFERKTVVHEAVDAMQSMNGAKLGDHFQEVQEAVKSRDGDRIYRALVEAGAACLETAARRGPTDGPEPVRERPRPAKASGSRTCAEPDCMLAAVPEAAFCEKHLAEVER